MPQEFRNATPIFRVANLRASIEYYVTVLGFKLDWEYPFVASVSRGRCGIFLAEGDQGNPGTWTWIGVSDADTLFDEYQDKGAKVRKANFKWAYEMQVEDLDGNVLRLGSEAKPDVPLGPWRDMHGDRWSPTPGGGSARVEGN